MQRQNMEMTTGCDGAIPNTLARDSFRHFDRSFAQAKQKYLDNDTHISKQLIYEYLRVVDRILSDFPPENYIYVTLGASATFIMAIFENLPSLTAFDLPLSIKSEDYILFGDHAKDYVQLVLSLSPSEKRKILLIDYTDTGKSLEAATQLLRMIYDKNKIVPFGLRLFSQMSPILFVSAYMRMPYHVGIHIHKERAKRYRKYNQVPLSYLNQGEISLGLGENNIRLKQFFSFLRAPEARL